MENDQELRARLRYVTGESTSAAGADLDRVAARYRLERRPRGHFNYGYTVHVAVDPADPLETMMFLYPTKKPTFSERNGYTKPEFGSITGLSAMVPKP